MIAVRICIPRYLLVRRIPTPTKRNVVPLRFHTGRIMPRFQKILTSVRGPAPGASASALYTDILVPRSPWIPANAIHPKGNGGLHTFLHLLGRSVVARASPATLTISLPIDYAECVTCCVDIPCEVISQHSDATRDPRLSVPAFAMKRAYIL